MAFLAQTYWFLQYILNAFKQGMHSQFAALDILK